MQNVSNRRHNCCHEAGHAVAGVLNGDKLVLIIGYPEAPLTAEEKKLCGTRAATCSERGPLNCECGGAVKRNDVSMFKRRFYPGDASCVRCLEFVTKEVAVILSGGEATRVLMGEPPNPFELREDGNDMSNSLSN